MGCCDDHRLGSESSKHQLGGGDDDHIGPLLNHPAVKQHGTGIDSVLLGDYIMGLARLSASRVVHEGDAEYNQGERQAFEDKTTDQLRREILEELADVVSYAAFLAIKVGAEYE